MSKARLFAFLLLAALAVSGPEAEATNGLKLTAYGARAAGRGGVDYAYANDGTGPATNPAGMAFEPGNRLDNCWAVIFPSVKWDNSFGSFEDRDVPFFVVPAYSFGVFIDPAKDWEISPLFDLGSWGLEEDAPARKKAGEKASGEKASGEKASGEKAKDEKASDDKAGGDKAGGEKAKDEPARKGRRREREIEPSEPTEEELYGGRWRIGFGVFPVTGGKIQMKEMRTRGFAGPRDWETDVLTLAITPSLAFRFNRYVSLGFALQLGYGAFELDGGIAQPRTLLDPNFLTSAQLVNSNPQVITFGDTDDGKQGNGSFFLSGRLGLMINTQYFKVGLVYQERTHGSDYLGRATVDATDEVNSLTALTGFPNPSVLGAIPNSRGQIVQNASAAGAFSAPYDLRVQDFNFPRMVGVGFALHPHEDFSIGFDYTYIHWSEVMRVFKARLTSVSATPTNLDILTSPTIHVRLPLDWDNQHVIAVGATARVLVGDDIVEGVPSYQLVLRAGYNYAKNPAPGNTTLPQQPVITEHHLSGGFTFHWGPLVELTFAAEYALPKTVRTGNHRGDFTLSNSEQEVSILFLHFGLGVRF